MTLAEYLETNDISHGAFARALGVTQSTISRIVRGQIRVSRPLAMQIILHTRGAVTLDALPLTEAARRGGVEVK